MSLPEEFVEYIGRYPEFETLAQTLECTEPGVSVRVNSGRGVSLPVGVETVPWCADSGMYINGPRPQFTFDPAMHQGLYYVQDSSSMAIASAIRSLLPELPDAPVCLDACAAPGGKTTCAIDTLPDGSLVVANEYDFKRANILAENLMKWGDPRTLVTRGDTARFRKLQEVFDLIIADVPCSGEGMMRKDASAVAQWSRALVEQCAERQREIVDNLWQSLQPGGFMIYSTCTFNRMENEEMVEYLINEYGAESVAVDGLGEMPGIVGGIETEAVCYRFIPGRVRGEGLFMAVLHKPGCRRPIKFKPVKAKTPSVGADMVKALEGEFAVEVDRDSLYAVPTDIAPIVAFISKPLDVVHRGVKLATIKGRDVVPHQSLALSKSLRKDAFPTVEVGYADAISYLRRQTITLADAPRGDVLLAYGDYPLGFVKNLGNRANNRYPEHWAILSSPPAETVDVLNRK